MGFLDIFSFLLKGTRCNAKGKEEKTGLQMPQTVLGKKKYLGEKEKSILILDYPRKEREREKPFEELFFLSTSSPRSITTSFVEEKGLLQFYRKI